jgi:MFS family permease
MFWAVGEGLWLHIQPLYLSSLGATSKQIGFILAIAGLARLLVMVPAGLLADRYGARNVMLPGWFLGFIGVVLIAVAPDFYILTLGFFLYGTSAAAIPIINLYVLQSIHEDKTVQEKLSPQQVLTFVYALFWLAQIISPSIGGILADWLSLRAVFGISAIWFALSAVVITRTESYPLRLTMHYSARQQIAQYRAMMADRNILAMYGVFVLTFCVAILGYTFAPLYLEDVHHLSRSSIGVLGSLIAMGGFVWNMVLGQYNAWNGLLVATAITGLAFGLLILSGFGLILIVAYFCMGAFEALRPIANSIVASRTAATTQGTALGITDTLYGVGTFVAPSVAGILYAQNASLPFIIAILFIPWVYLGVWWMIRRDRVTTSSLPSTP